MTHVRRMVRAFLEIAVAVALLALSTATPAQAQAAGLARSARDKVAAKVQDRLPKLADAARSVIRRLGLEARPYDIVLSGGTFAAVPSLAEAVASLLRAPSAAVRFLADEPAAGAVRLALEELA